MQPPVTRLTRHPSPFKSEMKSLDVQGAEASARMAGSPDRQQGDEGPQNTIIRLQSYLHGGTSSFLSTVPTVLVFPVYKTIFRQQIHNTSVHQAVVQLYKEGPLKLYRGVAPPLLMRTLNGTLLFGLQDTLLSHLSRSTTTSAAALPALAGFGVGIVEAVVFTPIERVQNVLQNGHNDKRLPSLRSVLMKLKVEGISQGYYRAFLPIAARNALGSSLYFGLKGPVCAVVAGQGLSPTASSFVSGTLTSMVISLTLYPLSVLVANMQAQVLAMLNVLFKNSSKMGDNNPVNQEVEQFNKQKLKKTNTAEKNRLPTKEVVKSLHISNPQTCHSERHRDAHSIVFVNVIRTGFVFWMEY
ncbi:hypothetical protein CCH79_00005881 [Gambusia affinis]|uniref:Solute carrier family 25 member 53 n=1 Tax=Gambusia affinis TaxID=33528 RepID=A0A315VJC3_GAMAF|nr:hypothetical protein CCH79_00005881 [Gambusia affinis]